MVAERGARYSRLVRRLFALVLTGCSFHASGGTPLLDPDAVAPDAGDAAIDALMEGIDFLPPAEETLGTTNWSVGADTAIDTTTLAIIPPPPTGVTLLAGVQDNGKPIAILRVHDLTIGAKLSATGDKPLAILADHDVTISGTLDVGAHLAQRGPGGSLGGAGAGAGNPAIHDNGTGSGYDDSGAGGASVLASAA